MEISTSVVAFATNCVAGIGELPTEAERLAAFVVHFAQEQQIRDIEQIIGTSASQALSWDALKIAASNLLLRGNSLPHCLAVWLAEMLMNQRPRPPRSKLFKSWPGATAERDLIIHAAVMDVCEQFEMLPTRNDASPPRSGCDAVAAAMQQLNLKPSSSKEIKSIFLKIERKWRSGSDPSIGVALTSQLIKDTLG